MKFARGLLFVMSAAVLAYPSSDTAARERPMSAKAVRLKALDLQNAASVRLANAEREVQQLALQDVFSAAALTSRAGIERGHAALGSLRTLVATREAALDYHAVRFDWLKKSAATPDGVATLASIEPAMMQTHSLQRALDKARLQVADAGDAVLAWAQAQGDSITLEAGRIKMKSPEQQAAFDSVFKPLQLAMSNHERAVVAAEKQRKANHGHLRASDAPPHLPMPKR